MIAQIWHRGPNIKYIKKKIWGDYENNKEDWSQSCMPSIAQPHGAGEKIWTELTFCQSLLLYLLSSELLCPCGQCLPGESLTFVVHRKGIRKGTLAAQHMPTSLGLAAMLVTISSMGGGPPIRMTPPSLSKRLLTLLNPGKQSCRQVRISWVSYLSPETL